jgi:hypothetical protein
MTAEKQLNLDEAAKEHADGWAVATPGAIRGAFKAGAEWQKQNNSGIVWIKCEDQLPELYEYVLVNNTEGAILIGRRFTHDWVAMFSDGEKAMGELKPIYWAKINYPK